MIQTDKIHSNHTISFPMKCFMIGVTSYRFLPQCVLSPSVHCPQALDHEQSWLVLPHFNNPAPRSNRISINKQCGCERNTRPPMMLMAMIPATQHYVQ